MLLGFHVAPMFSRHQSHLTLFGEALEDRCLLSANPPVNFAIQKVEILDERVDSSQFVEPGNRQSQQDVLITEVFVAGAGRQLTQGDKMGPTSLSVSTDPGSTDDNLDDNFGDNFGDDKIVPLIAIQPDDSIDPFVNCPGLDKEFCLPREIDFDFEIDFLDVLIFGTRTSAATWMDNSFEESDRIGQSDFPSLDGRHFHSNSVLNWRGVK